MAQTEIPDSAYGPQPTEEDLLKADRDEKPRCWRCGKLLAELLTRPWRIRCNRCKALNKSPGSEP